MSMRPLRPYQREACGAILRAVRHRDLPSLSVVIARQGGKNELSAQAGVILLASRLAEGGTAVKCAPTFRPQARISMARLLDRLDDAGLRRWARVEDGHTVRLGRARHVFLSAERGSNVVGHTADVLLEVDEAQDVEEAKFDKEFRPMTASTGAPIVFYGTPWNDACLLERVRQAHLEAERRDGRRRHFEYDWQAVAQHSPAYGDFVLRERERQGADHPLFLTQYCLKTVPGAGRLLSPAQLSALNGSHVWLESPLPGDTYVAGLDVGGEAGDDASSRHDSTVLTVARVVPRAGSAFAALEVEVVRVYVWTGEAHSRLHGMLASLLAHTWRAARLAVDATGLGEPVAAQLRAALPRTRVEAHKLSAEAKSRLGFELLAAVNGGRLRLPGAGDAAELRELRRQLAACRATYRANRTLNFYVDERDGHDDCVVSLALAVAAAADSGPRRAVGRTEESSPEGGHRWLP